MDTISLYKHRIDALMDILFGAGVSNPQTIIEQLNYLLFLRALSIKDDEAELLGITDESEKIFTGDLAKYRWQNLLALNAEDLFKTLELSFDVLQKKSKNPTVKLLFRNAHIKIFDKPTLRRVLHEIETFAKELEAIAHEGNKDVFGDMYEYLLSKLSSAGTNGQFRTPRHIIDFMVKVVDPKKSETILDPACGTAGFLVAAYRYIAGEYTSDKLKKAGSPRAMDKLSADEKQFLFNHMFTGFDSDEDMIKFGMMNLHLHGLTRSRLARQNSLTDTSGMKDKFDVILANPPFSGKIDEESVTEDLRMGTKATELLFLRFMMDHLSLKGKLAVIIPEGVVFNASNAHTKIRQMLIEKGLWAVVSLPSGVFNPYAGVKTSLLFLDNDIAKKKTDILFVKVENDGFDLGAQRRPIDKNDLTLATETLNTWKSGEKVKNNLTTYIEKKLITDNKDISLSSDRYRLAEDHSNAEWPIVELGSYITTITPPKKILKGNFGKAGAYPVIDQSQEEISGWTDDTDSLIKSDKPLVIFGDHTCAVKYTEKPFAQGADGIKILQTNDQLLPRFLYHTLKAQPIKSSGYQRHFVKLKSHKISLPPLEVQKQIVAELDGYQKVIEGAKQAVENWSSQIEIDPSWKMVRLGDISDKITKGTTPTTNGFKFQASGINFIKIESITDNGSFIREKFAHINEECNQALKRSQLKAGDVLFSIAGALGRVAVVDDSILPANTNQALAIISPQSGLDSRYLEQVLRSELIQGQINGLKVGVAQSNLSLTQVSDFQIPLPSLEVQRQIVEKMEAEHMPINTTAQLIPVFEQKIKDRLAKLWSS